MSKYGDVVSELDGINEEIKEALIKARNVMKAFAKKGKKEKEIQEELEIEVLAHIDMAVNGNARYLFAGHTLQNTIDQIDKLG